MLSNNSYMGRIKYLFKNIGLLTVGQFVTQIISFLLTPLYTSILTTAEYGTYDIYLTTVSLMVPILTVSISQAVLRFSLESTNAERSFSVGVKVVFRASLIAASLILLNHVFRIITLIDEYWPFLFLMFITTTINELLSSFARGIDKVASMAISGVIGALTTIILSILLLVVFKLHIEGYFYARVIGMTIQCIYLFFSLKIWSYFKISKINREYSHEMIKYSWPLIWNNLSWWVNDISNRYVVTYFNGIVANGIYAAANKIPSMVNFFQTIFNKAWTLSAVIDFDKDDSTGFFCKTYQLCNIFVVLMCSTIITANKIISSFLFSNEFFEAWRYVPFLMISVIFGCLSGYIGGIFVAVKDTKVFSISTISGAITNIVLSVFLTKSIGPLGAAIATTISSFLIWLIRMINVKKYIVLRIPYIKNFGVYGIILFQTVVQISMNQHRLFYLIEIGCVVVILLIYSKEIYTMIWESISILKRKNDEKSSN